ncbi:MAG: hypothetical protein K2I06_07170 [Ruminococcus sp.]|nr:hypothetical protein [Ruminococcus sp.]
MKKLFAVLMACAMMTGVFASCGSEEKEEGSKSKKDISVSESAEDDKTTQPETEEETEEDTTESETEEETESETEEETTESDEEDTNDEETEIDFSAATSEGSLEGTWVSDELFGFSFESDGKGGIIANATEKMHFTADGSLAISSITVSSESISYDGTTLSVNVENNDMLTMTRNGESDSDSYDGEYRLISGALYDGMATSMSQSLGLDSSTDVYVIVDGEELFLNFSNLFTYTAENGNLEITGNCEALGIPDGSIVEYKFSDDKLILVNGENETIVFRKVEF